MKKLLESIFITSLIFGFFYLMGSFCNASFNLNDWTNGSRFIISYAGGFIGLVFGLAWFVESKI